MPRQYGTTQFQTPSVVPSAIPSGGTYYNTTTGKANLSDGTSWWPLASELYVQSRSTNLITNGTGLYKNNTNFTGWTFTAADAPTGYSGSFVSPAGVSNVLFVDEVIPVDPNKKFRLQWSARQTQSTAGGGYMYGGLEPRDAYNNIIGPNHYMYVAGTDTTLAVQLINGATTITLTDATNWYGSAGKPAGASTHLRSIIPWNYVDPGGKAWGVHLYSRNVSAVDLWADGSLVGNVITLRAPWAGGTIPAGTAVSNGSSGGTYLYTPSCTNVSIPLTWTTYADSISGVLTPNGGAGGFVAGWPPATAACRIMWLVNRNVSGPSDPTSTHAIAGISFDDGAATAYDLSTLTANYVTLATAQTITGQKVFQSSAIGTTALVVRDIAGQTALMQDWQTSGSISVASVSQSGFAAFNGLNVNGAGLSYAAQIAHTTDVINLFIKANAAQATTRKLFEIQDNNAASMFSTTKDGLTTVTQVATGTVPLRVQGIASPTVNIFEVLSSTAYGYFAVSNLGVTTVGNTLSVVGLSAANIPLTVKGQPSQTGDLTQWLNSGNTVLSRIDSDGRWVVTTPVPAGGDSAGPTTFIVRAYTGQFYRNVFRVEQDNGTEITNVGAGQQTWFNLTGMGGGSLSVTYDFWSKPSGANVSVRAGVETQSAFRAVRDVTSPFLRVAEFGSRDFGALTDTVNAYITMAGDATFRTATVTNGTVSGNLALTTKQYVDNLVGAVPVYAAKPVVRAATNGENITNLASAPSPTTIDGYAMQNADRILLKDQSTASQNGVYIWDSTGLARAGDQDTVAEIAAAVITVERGTVNGKSMWMNTNNVAGTTLGATAITYKPLLEVAIQAGPTAPTNAQDLWVDTADTAVPLGITPGPWTTLPLLAGLQAYSVNQTPQYRINGEYTELRGWVATVSGAVSAIASWPNVITLPAEARCVRDFVTYSSAHSNAGAGTIGNVARLETRKSDGMIYFSVAASYPTFSWFSLDGWSFVRS